MATLLIWIGGWNRYHCSMPEGSVQLERAGSEAWSERELANPHAAADKASKVRGMFGSIAPTYDLNNRVHSLWRDQAWRRFAVRHAQVRPGEEVLDVACGTGDLTEAFASGTDAKKIVGADFTVEMLEVARRKRGRLSQERAARVEYVEADAQSLPFADASFDVVSIAFGIRNVAEPARAIAEFRRVLRTGGRILILEFDRPRNVVVRWFNDWYCGWLMPRSATLISGDKSGAYKYLPRSVGTFMPREQLLKTIASTGFRDVTACPLSMGMCVCYRGFAV